MTTSTTELVDSSPELEVVAGVDTHADTHHVAVVSITGARLGDLQVPTTTAGYERLLNFIRSFGSTRLVGVEGTSSYGLTRAT